MSHVTYRIGEVAEATGLPPTTLRYYEDEGLLPDPERSHSGQRLYRPAHIERLRFILRAKRLGLSLEEISVLADAWEHQRCSVTHEQLVTFLDTRLARLHDDIAELTGLARQLEEVYEQVAGQPAASGRCGTGCGCAPALEADVPQRRFDRLAVAAE